MRQTKYIVIASEGKELIFTFPASIDHDKMFEAVTQVRRGFVRWVKPHIDAEAISAGFVSDGFCVGRSDTLDLNSRGEVDDKLLHA